jgi:hypothetical protein
MAERNVSGFAVTGARRWTSAPATTSTAISTSALEAINLNDETFSTHGRLEEQVLDLVDSGRRFTPGVHAKW